MPENRTYKEVLASIETHIAYINTHLGNIDQHLNKLNERTGKNESGINSNTIWRRVTIGVGTTVLLGIISWLFYLSGIQI